MVEYIAPTPRKKIGRKEATKIFLAHNGMCCNCGQQISVSEDWFIEHPEALILGGSDGADNRRPAHVRCKAEKDAADAAARSARDRIVTKHYQPDEDARPNRGFRRSPAQKRATTPLSKGVGLAYFQEDADV